MIRSLVAIEDDFAERNSLFGKVGERRVAAGRQNDVALIRSLHYTEDDVFLQDFIVLEGVVPRLEHMNLSNRRPIEKHLPERLEVGAVAKATGGDCDEFAAVLPASARRGATNAAYWFEVSTSDRPQSHAMVGNGFNFLVGRIQDGMGEIRGRAVSQALGGGEDEIFAHDFPG